MKANKYIPDDLGGAFSDATQRSIYTPNATIDQDDQDSDELNALYAQPIGPVAPKHHNANSLKQRLKAKRLAEARLLHLSDELSKIADEIRYLNPLMAETLDEAWEATEDAIEMLSNEHLWS